jgi:hypothetical protein
MEVSEEEFLKYVSQNVVAWTDTEKQKVESVLKSIKPRLETLALPFPETIYLVKTTGNEEGGAAYTRGNAIVFPKAELAASTMAIQKLICHELFHILSRANDEVRERLYEVIGFTKCNEIEFPDKLKSRKITNPDAPKNDHCILVHIDGKPSWAVPILLSSTEKFDVNRGGELFDYLQFRFLLVERSGDPPAVRALHNGAESRLVDMRRVSGFIEQVGKNTGYIIHPEEILADNFALLVLEEQGVPSPEILEKMRKALSPR